MKRYSCDDGNAEIEIEAESAQDAAQEYVDEGEWGDDLKTHWVDVWVTQLDGEPASEREQITITVNPDEPDCTHDDGHVWARPYAILGGLRENPGVRGHGGGTRGRDVCLLCGLARDWTNWAQRPDTGEQGLDSVEYLPDTYDIEVHASVEDRHAIELDDVCYVVDATGDEPELSVADADDEVGDYLLTEDGWECPVTVQSTGFLHNQYQGQTEPQDCYVELDCRDGVLKADWDAEIGTATPMAVWHGHAKQWAIPPLRAEAADELLASIKPLARRVVAGYSTEWDATSNRIARYNDDALDAIEQIGFLCEETHTDDLGQLHVWQADEWLSGLGDAAAQAEELGITATTSDDALEAIENRVAANALRDDVDVLTGLDDHLAWVRKQLQDAAEFEIEFGQLGFEYGVGVPKQYADVDVRVYVGDDNEWHVGTGGELDLLDEEWAPRNDEQAAQLRKAAEAD